MTIMPEDMLHELTERVEKIERLLSADHTAEGEELSRSIEHLGISAASLAKALHDVDASQRDLAELRKSKADSTDLEDLREQHRKEMLRVRGWLYSAIVVAVGLIGATVFAFWMYARATDAANVQYAETTVAICEQRSEQSKIVRDYLKNAAERALNNPSYTPEQKRAVAKESMTLASAFPDIDCGELDR